MKGFRNTSDAGGDLVCPQHKETPPSRRSAAQHRFFQASLDPSFMRRKYAWGVTSGSTWGARRSSPLTPGEADPPEISVFQNAVAPHAQVRIRFHRLAFGRGSVGEPSTLTLQRQRSLSTTTSTHVSVSS